MAIPPPNYTQLPNVVLDAMPQMKEAELRVTLAVCRMTFGWHKEHDKLSISQIEELTGLSRQGAINGVQAGMERGVIVREPVGAGFLYRINVEPLIPVAQPVNLVDTLPVNLVDTPPAEPPASQLRGLEVVNVVDQQVVNVVDPQKKEDKEKKEIPPAAATAAAVPFEERPNAFAVYESEIGLLTPNIADLLKDDLATYPAPWVEDAIREAARNNVRRLSYVQAILKRWAADGRGAGKPQRNGSAPARTGAAPFFEIDEKLYTAPPVDITGLDLARLIQSGI